MQTLKVDLGERSYPIYIGEGLLDQRALGAAHCRAAGCHCSNETVAPVSRRLSKTLGPIRCCRWYCPMAKPTRTGKPCS